MKEVQHIILGDQWWAANGGHVGVVAVEGNIGDWAAYIGISSGKSHKEDAQRIAEHGGKLLIDHACLLFPWLDRKKYRE